MTTPRKARYVHESMCACGFPMLSTKVPLGTEYELLSELSPPYSRVRCGGCGTEIPCAWVFVRRLDRRRRDPPGWLPRDIFEIQ